MAASRAILIARPCLIVAHLRDQLEAKGLQTNMVAPEHLPQPIAYDVCVIFLTKCETQALTQIRTRVRDLRCHNPDMLTIALIEEGQIEASDFGGFSTVIIGLPSLPYVLDAITQLVILKPNTMIKATELGADIVFTPRERDILDFLRRGMPNKLIAHELGVTLSTIKTHLYNIMRKVKATNRTEVVARMAQHGNGHDRIAGADHQ